MAAFTSVKIGLIVGVGGGAPSRDINVWLGDMVISNSRGLHEGIVQYDLGKSTPSGFNRTGHLNKPSKVLWTAVTRLQADHLGDPLIFLKYFVTNGTL